MKIINARDLQRKKTLNAIFYGAPGVGKTTLAATSPKPLFIDLEGGAISIMDMDIDIAECRTSEDVKEAIEHAIKNDYKTIVIDSLTRYTELLMDEIIHRNSRTSPQIQDWLEVGNRVKKMAWFLQEKEINLVFTCLESEESIGDQVVKRPKLSKDLRSAIPGIVDLVGYVQILPDGAHVLNVTSSPLYYAKHRTIRSNTITEDLPLDFKSLLNRIYPTESPSKEANEQ